MAHDTVRPHVPHYLRDFHALALVCRRFSQVARLLASEFADYYVRHDACAKQLVYMTDGVCRVLRFYTLPGGSDSVRHGEWTLLRPVRTESIVESRRRFSLGKQHGTQEHYHIDEQQGIASLIVQEQRRRGELHGVSKFYWPRDRATMPYMMAYYLRGRLTHIRYRSRRHSYEWGHQRVNNALQQERVLAAVLAAP
jgi:hypothetical protein